MFMEHLYSLTQNVRSPHGVAAVSWLHKSSLVRPLGKATVLARTWGGFVARM